MIRKTWAFVATALLASRAAAHGGHGAPPLHLHDAEMLGLAALTVVAVAAVGAGMLLWFSGRK